MHTAAISIRFRRLSAALLVLITVPTVAQVTPERLLEHDGYTINQYRAAQTLPPRTRNPCAMSGARSGRIIPAPGCVRVGCWEVTQLLRGGDR